MQNDKLHTPIGVRDVLAGECAVKNAITAQISEVFHRYGYEDVESPMFEFQEVFADAEKGSTDPAQLYKFFDQDGASLALRADMTPPIARIAATAYANWEGPLKFSYHGNAFRMNKNYQGKLREYPEAGVEFMGASGPDADAEVIAVAVKALLAIGLTEFKINIGEVGFFKGILASSGLNQEDQEEVKFLISKRNYADLEHLIQNRPIEEKVKELFLALPKLVGGSEVLDQAAKMTDNPVALAALERLKELHTSIGNYHISSYISYDLGMVNKLNYYTGIIFRGYTYGVGFSIVDGGRYDNLVGEFGKDCPSVGFALRITSIMNAVANQNIHVDVKRPEALIAYQPCAKKTALRIAEKYRRTGKYMLTSFLGENLEENIAYAKKMNLSHVLYFRDGVHLTMVSLKDEMGGFTVDLTINDLKFPAKEEKA
ncbi:MAG: ATP phosphoribosyltransferase regulatory subunit [Clostridiales bacterium]|nr:ATP phosphoribosyltransferase regulatory subunit [Clostridiales bacterium]